MFAYWSSGLFSTGKMAIALFNFQRSQVSMSKSTLVFFKVPIAANYKGVCLQNTSKSHSYHLKIWRLL